MRDAIVRGRSPLPSARNPELVFVSCAASRGVAIELVRNKASREPYPWQERRGLTIYRHGLERGVLLRPVGNVVYFMPPYVITPEEIDLMVDVARDGIGLATCA